MCVICYSEKRALTKKEFENCWKSNKDGAGFAWEAGGKIYYQKGFTAMKKAWQFYRKSVARNLPHVSHFRITSTGETVPELTHPFIVSTESPLKLEYHGTEPVLFHNGTISGWKDTFLQYCITIGKIPAGKMSDTRMASMLISKLGERALEFLSGKFVLFNTAGRDTILYGNFEDVDGVYFSNDSYKEYKPLISYGSPAPGRYYDWESEYFGTIADSVKSEPANTPNYDRALSNNYCTCAMPSPALIQGKIFCDDCGLQIDPESEFCKEVDIDVSKCHHNDVEYFENVVFCNECGVFLK